MDNYIFNQVQKDEFGRTSGVLLVDKPVGIGSHDIVYKIRKIYATKKVGHAGALDPFASGLLIILIGKATKLSDSFSGLDKSYQMRILLGVSTDSGDTEGKVLGVQDLNRVVSKSQIEKLLSSFKPSYEQYVPVFSSVKLNGQKLRVLARKYDSFRIVKHSLGLENESNLSEIKIVEFLNNSGKVLHSIELPHKPVKIWDTKILDQGLVSNSELLSLGEKIKDGKYQYIDVSLSCSKGTYVRQFAADLGEKLGVPAMLTQLRRTSVGEYSVEDSQKIE